MIPVCMETNNNTEEHTPERYLSVCVLSDPREADCACALLEESGIPVIIQHLNVSSSDEDAALRSVEGLQNAPGTLPIQHAAQATGFRLLVPMYLSQTALKLLRRRSSLHPPTPADIAPQRAA